MLLITKPLQIRGQERSVLEITEGPIAINIDDNYDNETVKISQLKIYFNVSDAERSFKRGKPQVTSNFTFLFKLFPGSLLELEDCDISSREKFQMKNDSTSSAVKNKVVCFVMNSKIRNKKPEEDGNIIGNTNLNTIINTNTNPNVITQNTNTSSKPIPPSISILTLTSTRIYNFYQTVRAGENCIVNMEKCNIKQNSGKCIVMINPLIMKIIETTFEKNNDNTVHIKFLKDDYLKSNRKFYFKQNTFEGNCGSCICIEGIENFLFDLDIAIIDNTFACNKFDAVMMWDLTYKSLDVSNNQFLKNRGNGLNIHKVVQKEGIIMTIKGNNLVENGGFGIFINDCRAIVNENILNMNKASGIILCSLQLDNPAIGLNTLRTQNTINNNTNSLSTENTFQQLSGNTLLNRNKCYKNGDSGLKILNYNSFVTVTDCIFIENCEHGIFMEIDNNSQHVGANINNVNNNNNIALLEKIKNFKNADRSKMPSGTHILIQNSIIERNMKSGLAFSNCFIYLDNTTITDNFGYAIYTPKEEFRHWFKESKSRSSNLINGNIGGEWGEVSLSSKVSCSGCSTKTKIRRAPVEQIVKTGQQITGGSHQGDNNSNQSNKGNIKSGSNDYPQLKVVTNSNNNKDNCDKNKPENEGSSKCIIV
jgi:hypothetical protein